MAGNAEALDYVEYGDAETIYYDGVARTELVGGNVVFACWRWVTTVIDGRVERKKVVVQYTLMPVAGVQDSIEQCVEALGPRQAFASLASGATEKMLA